MIESIIEMIDLEFEDIENERKRERNLKVFLGFEATSQKHKSVDIPIKPKYDKKLKSSKYIKPNRNSNELF